MFAHMMQLGGVRGLEEYNPENLAQSTETPPGLMSAGLQASPSAIDASTGMQAAATPPSLPLA